MPTRDLPAALECGAGRMTTGGPGWEPSFLPAAGRDEGLTVCVQDQCMVLWNVSLSAGSSDSAPFGPMMSHSALPD